MPNASEQISIAPLLHFPSDFETTLHTNRSLVSYLILYIDHLFSPQSFFLS